MLWTTQHDGFHGLRTVKFRVPNGSKEGDTVEVSEKVFRRINREICPSETCSCGEGIGCEHGFGGRYYVVLRRKVRGRYSSNR